MMKTAIVSTRVCVGCYKPILPSHRRIRASLVPPDIDNEESASLEWGVFHENCFLSVVGSTSVLDLGELARKAVSAHGR